MERVLSVCKGHWQPQHTRIGNFCEAGVVHLGCSRDPPPHADLRITTELDRVNEWLSAILRVSAQHAVFCTSF